MRDDGLDVLQVTSGGRATPVAVKDGRIERLAVCLGPVLVEHKAAPEILAANPVALVEQQRDPRRPDFFARMQFEMRERHSSPNASPPCALLNEVRRPFPGPAETDDDHKKDYEQ